MPSELQEVIDLYRMKWLEVCVVNFGVFFDRRDF